MNAAAEYRDPMERRVLGFRRHGPPMSRVRPKLLNQSSTGHQIELARPKLQSTKMYKQPSIVSVERDVAQAIVRHRMWLERKRGGERAKLSKMDLAHNDLAYLLLDRAAMVGTRLHGASLIGSKMVEADLFGADLTHADLREANMTKADMRGSCLQRANLNHAVLTEADFRGGAILGADGIETARNVSDLSECVLDFASLARAQMTGADLHDSSLIGANLEGAILKGANLTGADFTGANLRGAVLSRARIENANFEGADMSSARIDAALVRNTNFKNADLTNVDFAGVDLSTSNLDRAKLLIDRDQIARHLRRALEEHDEWVRTDGEKGRRAMLKNEDLNFVDLSGQNLGGIVLTGSKLRGSDLSGCVFALADLSGCDLTNANLANTTMLGVVLTGANLSAGRADGDPFQSVGAQVSDITFEGNSGSIIDKQCAPEIEATINIGAYVHAASTRKRPAAPAHLQLVTDRPPRDETTGTDAARRANDSGRRPVATKPARRPGRGDTLVVGLHRPAGHRTPTLDHRKTDGHVLGGRTLGRQNRHFQCIGQLGTPDRKLIVSR